ncbi:MAG: DMT family transporter [Spirochaetales bacterium]|nr:DMT family transporter [Spirochaetales bacterium]
MFLILSIFTGAMVALMIQLNGVLQEAAGAVNALLFIHLAGMTASAILFMVFRNKLKGEPGAKTPLYYLTAGMVGTAIVFLASLSFQKGGILLSLSGSLAGQTLAASIIESFYPPGRQRSSIIQRILSPALLIPGSILIGLKAGAEPVWIILAWLPGILLMFQQSMNAGNTRRWGTPRTVVFNYISALIIILPMFFLQQPAARELTGVVSELPLIVIVGGGLIGVFTTGVIALLLLKAPALMVILGIYAGELAGGMLIDLYGGSPVAFEKIIGMVLIALGLGAGKLSPKKAVFHR